MKKIELQVLEGSFLINFKNSHWQEGSPWIFQVTLSGGAKFSSVLAERLDLTTCGTVKEPPLVRFF